MRFLLSILWQSPQTERTTWLSIGVPSSVSGLAAGAGVCVGGGEMVWWSAGLRQTLASLAATAGKPMRQIPAAHSVTAATASARFINKVDVVPHYAGPARVVPSPRPTRAGALLSQRAPTTRPGHPAVRRAAMTAGRPRKCRQHRGAAALTAGGRPDPHCGGI